ncbi:dethiobiotin synthase [Corynebacterium otitidis]|uniref:ATP-dependent dethiobiotin synthetase BioD n=1 Tax=Corynebacterium otitidis ATCC 51513 TaxID=883169 RepID=I7KIF5_9CORY|nr:dethiobiotin synthase [Corynebacterium otitidis]EJZ82725.1 dethiobiotin synthase [Corynebacterium otitidis ATCC 51513]CCI82915.1 dithiobiotin synthetase [Corynebacterium otitidis ATCC 51513]
MIALVTGTGTDVGKTVATAALAATLKSRGRRVAAAKPIETGEPEGAGDLAAVRRLAGVEETYNFVRLPEPLSPVMSARRAGLPQPKLDDIAARLEEIDRPDRVLLAEGAGGLLVELGEGWTIADLAGKLGAPLLVVTSSVLGSLNHLELTLEAARRRGLRVAGVVGGCLPATPDLAARLTAEEMAAAGGDAPWLGGVPEGSGRLSGAEFGELAPSWLDGELLERRLKETAGPARA